MWASNGYLIRVLHKYSERHNEQPEALPDHEIGVGVKGPQAGATASRLLPSKRK